MKQLPYDSNRHTYLAGKLSTSELQEAEPEHGAVKEGQTASQEGSCPLPSGQDLGMPRAEMGI